MRIRALIAIAGLAAALLASPAAAQGGHVRERVRAGELQPLDRILPRIRNQYPGDFYDAQGPLPGPDGQPNYRIKWLTPDGRVVWFRADARTGRIVGIEGGPRRWRNGPPMRMRPVPVAPGRGWWRFGAPRGWGGGRGHGRRGR
ncbi:MAG TPA: PepSY domain-containing protein [Rhizomicrobium sp.]|jgi:hypothetical protein|nr:PepSY domain-containing protein [Rhizomicrobium sp.]HEX4533349.1 PepSY domain-containing protein [Rhizomicrobium sp.]